MAMFLKVMHDGADEFLAEADSDATYSLYGDVVECHFKRFPPEGDPSHISSIKAEAFIRVREPVKTANVPGFVEVERHIVLDGDAFLMNEQGRTISKFKLAGYRAGAVASLPPSDYERYGAPKAGVSELNDEQRTAECLRNMPHWGAAIIRKALHKDGSIGAAEILNILNREKIAVDA